MLANYLKTALRNLWKQRGYSLINMLGLAIGMAVCVLILSWVLNELSYDRFHENNSRIYRLGVHANLGRELSAPISNGPSAPTMKEIYPEVEDAVRITGPSTVPVKYQDLQFKEEDVTYADNSIFTIFSFPLVIGDPNDVLAAPNQVVITESIAEKYFGGKNPVGEVLNIEGSDFTVTGVARDFPDNSHLKFTMIRSFETVIKMEPQRVEHWMAFSMTTYLLLSENTDVAALTAKFPELVEEKIGPILESLGASMEFWLQPLARIHLYSDFEIDVDAQGQIVYVILFSGIAILILLMACFNFINLATARSTTRAKEVGIRKTVGADRKQLMVQFLSESITLSLLSVVVAVLLIEIALPQFNQLSHKNLAIGYLSNWWIIPSFIGLALVTGLLAGVYPSLVLSGFQPQYILRAGASGGSGQSRLRQILVVAQFTISIILLTGTGIISAQINYLNNKPLGYRQDGMLILRNLDRPGLPPISTIKDELSRVGGVTGAAIASRDPSSGIHKSIFLPEGFAEDEGQTMDMMSIDPDYIPVMNIGLVAGRNFSADMPTDTSESVIINETAARAFKWDEPIGKYFYDKPMPGSDEEASYQYVVGVVKDFHITSLHMEIEPLYIAYRPESFNVLTLGIQSENVSSTLENLRSKWQEISSGESFEYIFLDEALHDLYQDEKSIQSLAGYFSLLAIIIGCLGLFGMSSFTAARRTKEIGVRKVLGASVSGIVALLSREIILLILISSALAYPVAWYFMNDWLNTFAYHIDFNWGIALLVTGMTIILALITVSYQSVKVALANPAQSLRYE